MTTLTITSAQLKTLEENTVTIISIDNNIFTTEIKGVEYKMSFYMMPLNADGSSYNQTLETEKNGGFKLWIEKDGKKTKRTMIYNYIIN